MKRMTLRSAIAAIICSMSYAAGAYADPKPVNVPAGDLIVALETLAKQSSVEFVYQTDQLKGLRTQGVSGNLSPRDAVTKLLEGTPLTVHTDATGAILIAAPRAAGEPKQKSVSPASTAVPAGVTPKRFAQADTPPQSPTNDQPMTTVELEEVVVRIPEVLVVGSKIINADIQRTEDDPQPYVVFSAEEIERSQAVSIEDFLKTRLPMNTQAGTSSQDSFESTDRSSYSSSINLRGLGPHQTLILVDGRRMPSVSEFSADGGFRQPDINGLPLGAIERIEVLPSTAGGIYGGGATGGVINIILKRDYSGLEIAATYGNVFEADAATRRVDASGGFSLEGGRTHVMFAASFSDANSLLVSDRDFAARGRVLQLANNPEAITNFFLPPLGATVNIRSLGGDLMLDEAFGGTALGSDITHVPLGYAGPASDNGAALVANAGQYNLALPDDLNGGRRSLFDGPGLRSISANLRRDFTDSVEAFLDLSSLVNEVSRRSALVPSVAFFLPSTAPNNPFQQDIRVRFPTPDLAFEERQESETLRAIGGIIARLPRDWTVAAEYGWSRSRLQVSSGGGIDDDGTTSLNTGQPALDGRPALDALQEGNTLPIDFGPYLLPSPNVFFGPADTILKTGTLRFSGPFFALPAGPVMWSALVERREEEAQDFFVERIDSSSRTPIFQFVPHRSQDVNSYYLEARLPLISSANAVSFARKLELQASVRRDEYETRNALADFIFVPSRRGPFPALAYATNEVESTSYTLALRYVPFEDVTLRASFGTGFLPPSLWEIVSRQEIYETEFGSVVPDPKRGGDSGPGVGGEVDFTHIYSGNPDLRPEQSESWSAGVIFTPRFAPGLRLSLDYTRIEKSDEIGGIRLEYLLDHEDSFPGRVVREPLSAADAALGYTGGVVTRLDDSLLNIAATTVEAYDIQVDYTLETGRFGSFHPYVIASWQPHYKNQILPTSPVVDSVGFDGAPLEWRGNIGVDWQAGPWTLGWNAQYYDSYFVYSASGSAETNATATLNQGSAVIPSQIYHDLTASYRFRDSAYFAQGLLAGAEISLGIQNVFDEIPPILATASTGGGYSTYGDPRLRRYTLSARVRF